MKLLLLAISIATCSWPQSWQDKIAFDGELRGRTERTDDTHHLHRIRLGVRVDAASWMRFAAQAQDARVFGNTVVASAPPLRDSLDLRIAYAEIGDIDSKPFTLRVGRQELVYGDQRLLGPSNWANAARTFDAVRAVLRPAPGVRVDAFAASVVNPLRGELNKHTNGDNLHGIYGFLETLVPQAVVEPYLYWRIAPDTDFKTEATRWLGKLPGGFDYRTEMAWQHGRLRGERLRAWAGHWVLGYTRGKTRWSGEYNYATGDDDPNDGVRNTFDLIYPTPHDKYGLTDRVGWRNIHHLRYGIEYKLRRNMTFVGNYHTWWLATTNDGLYTAPGALVARMPGAPRHVGHELDAQIFYTLSSHLQVRGGHGQVIPGGFLKAAVPGRVFSFPYVMVTWTFGTNGSRNGAATSN